MSTLNETSIYLGDNGRSFCGRLRCAGSSAFHTGRDLSGQRVEKVTPAYVREFDAMGIECACESCGQKASRVHKVA